MCVKEKIIIRLKLKGLYYSEMQNFIKNMFHIEESNSKKQKSDDYRGW
jgi:predicted subunit of tRNA(5-methylaminomethyl-2-thiouridylate) methyltransferase